MKELISMFVLMVICFKPSAQQLIQTGGIEIEFGFNNLNLSETPNEYYSAKYFSGFFESAMYGVNMNLIKKTSFPGLSVLIGGIVLRGGEQDISRSIQDYYIKGGGTYVGIRHTGLLAGKKPGSCCRLSLVSSFAAGFFWFGESLTLYNDIELPYLPVYDVYQRKASSAPGGIFETGPRVSLRNMSFSITTKAVVTGNSDLNVSVYGLTANLGFYFSD
jgi:hypothetical protein